MLLRPLRDDDSDAELARRVAERSFASLTAAGAGRGGGGDPGGGDPGGGDRRTTRSAGAWSAERVARFHRRARHLARHDAAGCWLAVSDDGEPVGTALSLRREGLWGLSLLAVLPGAQGAGVGRALLERALAYGVPALRGMICSSEDARAVRMYRLAGFRLHPAMRLVGQVERSMLRPTRWVRDGEPAEVDFADAVDWQVRGAPHGPDHALLSAESPLLLAETPTGRGYCYLRDGSPLLLAATDAATARELLWEALGRTAAGARVSIDDVTGEQTWAVDVAVAAGLHVLSSGFVCTRGSRPPAPYVPSAAWL